ncbi:MAG: hypothetical protein INR72_11190, partial [Williamsia herbipolensis]|nr:hypothetical protein [Williamsia herbipolensis]
GTVDLSGLDADAPLVVARPASVTVGAGGVLTSDGDNAVSFTSCCTDPAHLVNDGTVMVDHGTLDVAGVQFDQNGVLDVVGGMVLTHAAPVTASDGAAYEGDGAWRIADAGPAARLSGRQLLGGRFHLHLGGGSPAASETLGGDVTLAGSGTFDWDSGTVAAELTVGHDVTVVVDGARRGNDARQLRGIDDSGAKPIAATVVDHGTVEVTGGARIGTAETAHLVVATDGTLRIAAGAGLAAAECCTHPDRVDNAGTTRLSSGATLTDLDYHQIAGRTEVTGGALPPAHTVRVDGGELVGVRTVRGALVAAGQVTPDGAGIGALHVTGDYTQQRDATLAVDVAARAHDTVRVDGAADVAGRITVDTAAGLPGVGTRIRILTADAGLRVHAGTCVVTRGNGAATRHWKPMASADGLDLVMVQGSSPNC